MMAALKRRVHVAGYPTSGLDRLLAVVVLVVALTSCAPWATRTVNAATGDQAALTFITTGPATGLQFDPGGQVALGVIVDVQADALTAYPADVCEPSPYGVDCALGDVDSAYLLAISGTRVSASATYRRTGASRIYQEFATP